MQSAGKLYVIRAILGKGRGLVVTTKIAKGTCILSKVPIFTVRRDISNIQVLEGIVAKEIDKFSKDEQQAFFDLANIYGDAHSKPLGIVLAYSSTHLASTTLSGILGMKTLSVSPYTPSETLKKDKRSQFRT